MINLRTYPTTPVTRQQAIQGLHTLLDESSRRPDDTGWWRGATIAINRYQAAHSDGVLSLAWLQETVDTLDDEAILLEADGVTDADPLHCAAEILMQALRAIREP